MCVVSVSLCEKYTLISQGNVLIYILSRNLIEIQFPVFDILEINLQQILAYCMTTVLW